MTGRDESSLSSAGPVRAAHRFDEAALTRYLEEHLDVAKAPFEVRQFEGGQSNPTFLLIDAKEQRFVLRKKPPGALLPSAHRIEREFRVMKALLPTDVPVPTMRLLCEEPSVVGTSFYVMDFLDGCIRRDPKLPHATLAERAATFEAMIDVLAKIHRVDWRNLGLTDYGKPQKYAARQVAMWKKQYEASKTHAIAAMDWLGAWLAEGVPPEEEATLTHGDVRLDNFIFAPDSPNVLGVVDWELSTLGHPLADLAYACMAYHLPSQPAGIRGLKGADLGALGIPTEEAFLEAYRARTGRNVAPHYRFFLALAFFRLASITQGVRARALAGSASSARALEVGKMADFLAETGRAVAEGRE